MANLLEGPDDPGDQDAEEDRTEDHQEDGYLLDRIARPKGEIHVLFDNVSINGKKLKSADDFPNGLETQGNVKLKFK